MKVVLLAPTPPPIGGIAGWTVRMLNANLKNGWEIILVDEKIVGNRSVFGDNKNKRNYKDELIRCLTIWKKLKKTLCDNEVKIVHSCIPSATLSMMREYICACITKKRKRKFITHFRCTVPNTTRSKIGKFILNKLCKKSDLIISLNKQTTEYLRTLTETEIVCVPNFISHEELIFEKEINDEVKTILYVGGVIKEKGVYEIIDTAVAFPQIQFRLVGESQSDILEYIRYKMVNNVVLVGKLDKKGVRSEMDNADAFMFLSYFGGEGFSNALVEAMAAGMPCIVSDWAANSDMIDNGKGGIVVPIKSAHDVEKAVISILSKEIRQEYSSYNIMKVKSQYLENIIVDSYVDVYESCLDGCDRYEIY
ncbi:MAG: glycosyltransferase family 4 protein [Eubacteriales bacterium]